MRAGSATSRPEGRLSHLVVEKKRFLFTHDLVENRFPLFGIMR